MRPVEEARRPEHRTVSEDKVSKANNFLEIGFTTTESDVRTAVNHVADDPDELFDVAL